MSHRLGAAAVGLGLIGALAWPAPARAQSAHVVKTSKGWGYVFPDSDQLHSDAATAGSGVIRVRPRAARSTLIRPRVSFVPELLKSVEHL